MGIPYVLICVDTHRLDYASASMIYSRQGMYLFIGGDLSKQAITSCVRILCTDEMYPFTIFKTR